MAVGYAEMWDLAQRDFVEKGITKTAIRSTGGEITEGITAVCSRPENGPLTVLTAMILFIQKTAGASESNIEALAARFRKDIAKGAQ